MAILPDVYIIVPLFVVSFLQTGGFFPEQSLFQEEIMKKMRGVIMGVILAMGLHSGALAASGKCTIIEITGKKMVIECDQQAGTFKSGDKIKIKSSKTGGAVEGC